MEATSPAADLTLRSTRLASDGFEAPPADSAPADLAADDFLDLAAGDFAGLADEDFAGLAEAFAVDAADFAAAVLEDGFFSAAAFVPDDMASGFLLPAASFERAAIAAPAPVMLCTGFSPSGFAVEVFDPFAGFAADDFVDFAMTIPSVGIAAQCP
jgi:hypothetical protein